MENGSKDGSASVCSAFSSDASRQIEIAATRGGICFIFNTTSGAFGPGGTLRVATPLRPSSIG